MRELGRTRRAYTGPRLDVDAEGSTGGGAIADREWRVDSRLSSGLIDDEWRIYYDQSLGRGDTSIGNARWARSGIGLNWQRGRWLAEGAIQRSNAGPYRSSVAGRIDYRAGDAWRLSATFDGDSKEVPWKARVAGMREGWAWAPRRPFSSPWLAGWGWPRTGWSRREPVS